MGFAEAKAELERWADNKGRYKQHYYVLFRDINEVTRETEIGLAEVWQGFNNDKGLKRRNWGPNVIGRFDIPKATIRRLMERDGGKIW